MTATLPINVDNLLHRRAVESARIEFKASWDEKTTGPQVVQTICGFANDYQNLNGGYVVIGVREVEGEPELPPVGLTPATAEIAAKWLHGRCKAMHPAYDPVLSKEWIGDRLVLVIWASASDERPHRAPLAPKQWRYWIRSGSETVVAQPRQLEQLLEQTSSVPWDDRPATTVSIDALRISKVREYLHDVRSGLADSADSAETYRRMQITTRINDHEVPRNVGLLFFSESPDVWFRGARIEVVRFAGDAAARVQDERIFRGALSDQVRNCLLYLEGLSQAHLEKPRHQSQVRGWVSYPHDALREAVVNAVYHRSYRPSIVEPTKVFLHPDRMEIISYPGPVPGIDLAQLNDGKVPPLPARNRRIGEFLKELKLAEGRLTGLPLMRSAMEGNGSPKPRFDFDEGRSYFRVTLPAHPEHSAIQAIQDAAYLRTIGNEQDALERIRGAWEANRDSAVLAAELVRLHADKGFLDRAEDVYLRFGEVAEPRAVANVLNTLIDACIAEDERATALRLLREMPETTFEQDAVDTAILARRMREPEIAHRYFQRAGDTILGDSRALHEFAQTKMFLAQKARQERGRLWRDVNNRLLVEAKASLERVVQMDAPATRHAWAWRDLARVRDWLRFPASEVEGAYAEAMERLPDEQRFEDELTRFQDRARKQGNTQPRSRRNGRRPKARR